MSRISQIALSAALPLFVVTATNAATIFEQTFSSANTAPGSGVDSTYTSTTPDSGQFNDIRADGTLSTVAITNDDLVFNMKTQFGPTVSGNAGFLRSTNLANPVPTVLGFEMVFTYTLNNYINAGPGPSLQVGNYATTTSNTTYTGGGSGNDRFDDLTWRRFEESFYLEIGDTDPSTTGNQGVIKNLSYGTSYTVLWLLNNSGADQVYTGSDNVQRTLKSGHTSLYLNGALAIENGIADDNGNANIDLSALRFRATDVDNTIAIDSIRVYDALSVPEPATLALFSLGGLLAMRRWNRA